MAQTWRRGPVHGAVDSFLRGIGARGLFPGGGGGGGRRSPTRPSGPPKTMRSTMGGLEFMRQAAKTHMAVARSYHARQGTRYDPLSSVRAPSAPSKPRRRKRK